jgi:hypothetical protein
MIAINGSGVAGLTCPQRLAAAALSPRRISASPSTPTAGKMRHELSYAIKLKGISKN